MDDPDADFGLAAKSIAALNIGHKLNYLSPRLVRSARASLRKLGPLSQSGAEVVLSMEGPKTWFKEAGVNNGKDLEEMASNVAVLMRGVLFWLNLIFEFNGPY